VQTDQCQLFAYTDAQMVTSEYVVKGAGLERSLYAHPCCFSTGAGRNL
jgi:hypothetical protein